jgi:structure-specific endonuclease subunit SLX1
MSYVYLLLATPFRDATYVGATVDLDRRLRQHNKEIKGGATATSIKVAKGNIWIRAAHVQGFPDWQAALQFEWRWKQLTRKMSPKMEPLTRRMNALYQLLRLERPTTKAKAYSEWEVKPEIIFGDDLAKEIYTNIEEKELKNANVSINEYISDSDK